MARGSASTSSTISWTQDASSAGDQVDDGQQLGDGRELMEINSMYVIVNHVIGLELHVM